MPPGLLKDNVQNLEKYSSGVYSRNRSSISPRAFSSETRRTRSNGVRPGLFDASAFATQFAGQVKGLNLDDFIPKKEQRRMDPFCHYGVAAAQMAMADSGLDMAKEDPTRIGVIAASGVGGLQILQAQMDVLRTRGPSRAGSRVRWKWKAPMRRQKPWTNTIVNGASAGPASRTTSGTPSGAVTT